MIVPLCLTEQCNVTVESCDNAKFEGFSSSNKAIILEAHKKICNNLQKVINSVGDTGTYRKWFEKKTFTKARSDKVKDTYQKIYDAMINGYFTYKYDGPISYSQEKIRAGSRKKFSYVHHFLIVLKAVCHQEVMMETQQRE